MAKYKRPRASVQSVDPNGPIPASIRRLIERLDTDTNSKFRKHFERQLNDNPQLREFFERQTNSELPKHFEQISTISDGRLGPAAERATAQAAKQPAAPKHGGGRPPYTDEELEVLREPARSLRKQPRYRDSDDALANKLRDYWPKERSKRAPSTSTIKRRVISLL